MEVIGINAATSIEEEYGVEPAPFDVAGDNVVVEFVQREETTLSGIEIVRDKPTRPPDCIVVGIGPAATKHFAQNERFVVDIGTVLIVRKHEAYRLELGDDERELHVFKPASVIGVVHPTDS